MRLSMWVLADWMASKNVRADISEGPRELRNVRLLPSSGELSRSTVYLAEDESGNVLCMCGRDLIVVPDCAIDDVFNDILDCFEHYNDLDVKLRDLVAQGAEVSTLLNEAGTVLKQFFLVADATYYIHASGGDSTQLGDNAALWGSVQESIMPLSAIMFVNKQQGIRTRGRESYLVDVAPLNNTAAVTNLFDGDRHDGWLVSVCHEPHFTRGSLHIQDALAPLVFQCLRAHASLELRMDRAAVLVDLLEYGAEERERAETRLATLGWNRDDPKCIYVVRQHDAQKNPNHVVERFLERIDPTLVVVKHGGDTLLFANLVLVDESQLEEAMAPILITCGCVAGKSPSFIDTGAAAEHSRAAKVAAHYANARQAIVDFENVKLDYAITTLRAATVDIAHAAIGKLQAYDEKHSAQLLETLRTYLACACSATAAANDLFVHRTTLLYRLERIEEVGGVDLTDPQTRFHLDLSLRLIA